MQSIQYTCCLRHESSFLLMDRFAYGELKVAQGVLESLASSSLNVGSPLQTRDVAARSTTESSKYSCALDPDIVSQRLQGEANRLERALSDMQMTFRRNISPLKQGGWRLMYDQERAVWVADAGEEIIQRAIHPQAPAAVPITLDSQAAAHKMELLLFIDDSPLPILPGESDLEKILFRKQSAALSLSLHRCLHDCALTDSRIKVHIHSPFHFVCKIDDERKPVNVELRLVDEGTSKLGSSPKTRRLLLAYLRGDRSQQLLDLLL